MPGGLLKAVSVASARAAISFLPVKRGRMGWGSRPPPDRYAGDPGSGPGQALPLSGGGVWSKWRGAAKRAVLAGIAWGMPLAALLVGIEVSRCGVLCLTDAAMSIAVASILGIMTIGIFAALFGETAPGPKSRRNFSQKGKSWLAPSS